MHSSVSILPWFVYLVPLGRVKLAESIRGKALSMDVDGATAVPDPVRLDRGDDGGREDRPRTMEEPPEEQGAPHLCLHLQWHRNCEPMLWALIFTTMSEKGFSFDIC